MARPIQNLAVKIARKWIHGLSDLVVVLLATQFMSSISIILPVRKHIASGKSALFKLHTAWRTKSAHQNIHSWIVVCARALGPDEAIHRGRDCPKRKVRLTIRGPHARSRV
jgi:hypothetical protein